MLYRLPEDLHLSVGFLPESYLRPATEAKALFVGMRPEEVSRSIMGRNVLHGSRARQHGAEFVLRRRRIVCKPAPTGQCSADSKRSRQRQGTCDKSWCPHGSAAAWRMQSLICQ
jgi:hypothetical protein